MTAIALGTSPYVKSVVLGSAYIASFNELRGMWEARVRSLRKNISSLATAPVTHFTTDAIWNPSTQRGAVKLDLSVDARAFNLARIDREKVLFSGWRATGSGVPTKGA